jgi:hypothetical protein
VRNEKNSTLGQNESSEQREEDVDNDRKILSQLSKSRTKMALQHN